MPEVGRPAVCLALLFAAYAVFGLVVIATAILLRALLRHDFTLEYVAAYSSSTLPTQYTIAALWGGQKGSLLFWSLLLTLFTTIVQRSEEHTSELQSRLHLVCRLLLEKKKRQRRAARRSD